MAFDTITSDNDESNMCKLKQIYAVIIYNKHTITATYINEESFIINNSVENLKSTDLVNHANLTWKGRWI